MTNPRLALLLTVLWLCESNSVTCGQNGSPCWYSRYFFATLPPDIPAELFTLYVSWNMSNTVRPHVISSINKVCDSGALYHSCKNALIFLHKLVPISSRKMLNFYGKECYVYLVFECRIYPLERENFSCTNRNKVRDEWLTINDWKY